MTSFFCSFFSFMFVFYHGRHFLFLGTCKLNQNLLENSWKKFLLKPPRFLFPFHSPLQCWVSLKCKCIYFTLNCPSNISWFWPEGVEFTRRSKIHRPLWSKLCQIVFGVVVKVSPKSDKLSPLHNNSGWIWTQANERAKQIPIWHRRCFCSLIFSQESSEED